ncbi:MAG: glycosyltransferase family 2 protein [Prevotella sp.]
MTDKLLTLIIPSYNMEAYLQRCVGSLLCRENNRLEAIIVNDGSRDGTLALARKLERQHPEMVRVIDKFNGNYGSCINAALPVATGRYVKVLDADDSFDTPSLEQYLHVLEETQADYVVNDMVKVWPDHEERRVLGWPEGRDIQVTDVYRDRRFDRHTMHNIAYRTELVRRMGYRQTEGISYTDVEWNFVPMTAIRTMRFVNVPLYRYTLGREGQTVANGVEMRNFHMNVIVFKNMVEQFAKAERSLPPRIRLLLEHLLERRAKFVYRRVLLRLDSPVRLLLREADRSVKELNPKLTRYTDRMFMSLPLLPIHFVRLWRKHPDHPLFLLGRQIYQKMH